ncbi:MAG: GNAT family protein [Pirellulales bacterium]
MLPEICTDRFLLRRPVLADASSICEAVLESREQLAPWMHWCHPDYCLKDSQARIEIVDQAWERGSEYSYMIFDPADDRLVLGSTGLPQVYADQRRAELGYWIRTSHTGRGLATATARETARHAFEMLDLQRVEILVAVGNEASYRVAEKTGAAYEGRLRRRISHGDQIRDAHCFSLVREDVLYKRLSGIPAFRQEQGGLR